MKDEELIKALVADLRPVARQPRLGRGLGLFLVWSALSVLAFTRGGTTVADSPGTAPVALLLALLTTAAAGAIVSAIPGRLSWRAAATVAACLLLAWAGHSAIRTVSVWQIPAAVWGPVPWTKCFIFTLAFAVVPTAALTRIVNRGWPVNPRATAALTFGAGAAAGALPIALECPSHATLHLLLGHTLPIACAVMIGMWLASSLFVRPVSRPEST